MEKPDTKGLSSDIADYREAFWIASTFCEPYWELAARLYSLWRGVKPWQLEGTASKIMQNIAFGVVQDQLPKFKKNIFGGEDFVSLESVHPRYDAGREQAEAWLRNLLKDESQLNILAEIEPTLQSVSVIGDGYRMPFARKSSDGRWQVTSRDVDFFQILSAPVGGRINPQDRDADDSLPFFFMIDWMTDAQIKKLSAFDGYQKDQAEKCMASKIDNVGGIDNTYRELFQVIGGVNYGNGKNDWRTEMNDTERGQKTGRRRVVHWFRRDAWLIIAQDSYLIYKGKLPMGDGILPLVHYRITNDFSNWFGIGKLEMVEDLIITRIMNMGYRFDHLGRVMFPTKWIRSDVMGGRPESDFADRPYAIHEFPQSVTRFEDAVKYDRAPEITQQTFVEEDRLVAMMQSVNGSPDYSDAMGKSHGVGSSATGALGYINQVAGRVEAESMLLEGAVAQECRQLLILADKYINDEEFIRTPKSRNGTGWMAIDPDYLTDGYIVKMHGTKGVADDAQKMQVMMALYPLWNQDPMIDQYELRRAMADASGVSGLPKVVKAPQPAEQSMGMGEAGMGGAEQGGSPAKEPGGMSATQNFGNRIRAGKAKNAMPANMAM